MAPPQNSENEPSSKSSSDSVRDAVVPHIVVLTLFPELVQPTLDASLLGRARRDGRVVINVVQIRDFAENKHKTVDDSPFGGGEGMVLRPDVLDRAWTHACGLLPPGLMPWTVLTSPQGRVLDFALARAWAGRLMVDGGAPAGTKPYGLILVCGHYEGVDERLVTLRVNEEISIGDYVLTGGELAALVVVDAVLRFIPGVVGKQASVDGDTFEGGGLLKHPQYTKPRDFHGVGVPEILMSGDHGKVAQWRKAESLARTQARRPDLWAKRNKG